MLIIVYAVVLIFFWVWATYIKPEWFPQADPEKVHAWRSHRLRLYRRYAALLIIWILLAMGNGYLAGYFSHHTNAAMAHHIMAITVTISMIYAICILLYPMYHCYRNWQVRKHFRSHST